MLDRDKVPNLQNLAISEKYFIKKKIHRAWVSVKKLEELDCLSMVSNIGWRSFSDKRWSKGRKKEVQREKRKRKKERKRTIGSNEKKQN